jgi:hypothetical protein
MTVPAKCPTDARCRYCACRPLYLDPALIDEADLLSSDAELDMFDARNGPPYSPFNRSPLGAPNTGAGLGGHAGGATGIP